MKLPFSVSVFALALGLGASVAAVAEVSQAPTSAPSSADAASTGHHHRNLMNEALATLQLSADQQSKIDALRTAYRAKVKSESDPAARKSDATQFRSDVMAVLTPDQVTALKAEMKTLRTQARAQRDAMPAASPTP